MTTISSSGVIGLTKAVEIKPTNSTSTQANTSVQPQLKQDTIEISALGKQAMQSNNAVKKALNPGSFSIKNTNVLSWGLGLGKESAAGMFSGFIPNSLFLLGQGEIKALTGDISENWKKLDGKIAELLEANNIQLSKGETLNFKVDQSGAIKIGDGVSKDKAGKIEKILNADKTLGKELLLQHAKKSVTNQGLTVRNLEPTEKVRAILLDNILQTETGGSLSDVAFDAETGKYLGGNEKVDALLAEEPDLANELRRLCISGEKEGTDGSYSGSFDVSFSYKNGTVIDQELAGKSALDQRAKQTFRWMEMIRDDNAGNKNPNGPITIDFNGLGNRVDGGSIFAGMNDSLVQSFTEDALRLHQFEIGDTESGEHQLQVTADKGNIAFRVISPEADAAAEKGIRGVAEEMMNFLEKQTGEMADWMDIKLDENNKLSVKFGGEKWKVDLLSSTFDKLRSADTDFQKKTDKLIESLQKLHTDAPTVRIHKS